MNIVLLENLGCSADLIAKNSKKLESLGHNFKICSKTQNTEELKKNIGDADIVMLANMPLPDAALTDAKNVKFIDVAFTGVDHIPMKLIKERGIAVSNASGYANEAVAELCISFMIQLLRDINKAQEKTCNLETKTGLKANLLQGKTVGILGAGAIGTRLAELLKAFGAKVIAHNRRRIDHPAIDKNVTLDKLLEDSDIISIHLPLTEQTKGLIGKSELAKMKKGSYIINTGRGPVVDNKALKEALDNEQIAGAAVDVFDAEPPLPPDYPLLSAKNIILTPHIGFYTEEALEQRAEIVFDNLYSWLNGMQKNKIC